MMKNKGTQIRHRSITKLLFNHKYNNYVNSSSSIRHIIMKMYKMSRQIILYYY